MRTTQSLVAILLCSAALMLPGTRVCPGSQPAGADICERCRADTVSVVCQVPSHRPDSADVADHLSGGAAVGAVDQEQGRDPRYATVAPRPPHRYPGLQERSVTERHGDRHDPQVGRQRSAAGQSGRHADCRRYSRMPTPGRLANRTWS